MSVLLGQNWKALPATERAVYVEAAKKIKETFKAEHPECAFLQPSSPRASPCLHTMPPHATARDAPRTGHAPHTARSTAPHACTARRASPPCGCTSQVSLRPLDADQGEEAQGRPQHRASGDSSTDLLPSPPPHCPSPSPLTRIPRHPRPAGRLEQRAA